MWCSRRFCGQDSTYIGGAGLIYSTFPKHISAGKRLHSYGKSQSLIGKSIVNMQFSIAMLYSLPECTNSVSFIQKKWVHLDILLPGHLPAPQARSQPSPPRNWVPLQGLEIQRGTGGDDSRGPIPGQQQGLKGPGCYGEVGAQICDLGEAHGCLAAWDG